MKFKTLLKSTVGGQLVSLALRPFNSEKGIDPALTLTSVIPCSGKPGSVLTIHGLGFSSAMEENGVRFMNGVAGIVTRATPTRLTVVLPSGAATGIISVTVKGITVESTNCIVTVSERCQNTIL